MLRQNPFVKPDVEPIIAKTAGQILRPVLLGAFVAEEDIVRKVASGHAFWFSGGVKEIYHLSLRYAARGLRRKEAFFIPCPGTSVPGYRLWRPLRGLGWCGQDTAGGGCATRLLAAGVLSDAKIKFKKNVPEK